MPESQEDVFTSLTEDIPCSDVSIWCLCGELDASTVPIFLAEARRIIEQQRNVIMDVHLLEYVDSTGVSAMLSIRNALKTVEKNLCIVGCHGLLTKILRLTQVETELQCVDGLDSAFEALNRRNSL